MEIKHVATRPFLKCFLFQICSYNTPVLTLTRQSSSSWRHMQTLYCFAHSDHRIDQGRRKIRRLRDFLP